jgi:hypothetical protein
MAARSKSGAARATAGSGGGTSNSQTTALSPNSNCTAVGSGDSNNTTTVQFYAPPNGIAWWISAVSTAFTSAVLSDDIGNAIVTFKKGLTVRYLPSGSAGAYNVLLTGTIIDGGTTYNYSGSVIYMSTGTASNPVEIKRA